MYKIDLFFSLCNNVLGELLQGPINLPALCFFL